MITERVDDIPLLICELEKSDLSTLLTAHFPNHGNWGGANTGIVSLVFLSYILSCADHRTSHVEKWVSERVHTLRACTGDKELTSKDLTDDRLGRLLDKYADDAAWRSFEAAHNKRLIQVYSLEVSEQAIRLDAMITQSHREVGDAFQMGYSKQHRADLPQMKTMLAALDPYAMPLVSKTVAGNEADDGLYLPLIEELDQSLALKAQLFVGDSKLSSLGNRAAIHQLGHHYLCPLSKKQCSTEQLVQYLTQQPEVLQVFSQEDTKGQSVIKAKAFEQSERLTSPDGTQTWEERRLVVYSPNYAKTQQAALEKRLTKASEQLDQLLVPKQGRKLPKTRQQVQQRINEILTQHKVKDLIEVQILQTTTTKQVRAYGKKPARTQEIIRFSLQYHINQSARQAKIKQAGWRVYACNAPMDKFPTIQAVQCYRNEYRIEHKFDELLNRITALMPVYLHKPKRIKALIRLLLLALKFVSLIQMQARTKLKNTNQSLNELYPGNPARKTDKPTTTMLLKAFEYITLVIIPMENQTIVRITELKSVQLKILDLLGFKPDIYRNLAQFSFSNAHLRET